jgi:hypothetical protein
MVLFRSCEHSAAYFETAQEVRAIITCKRRASRGSIKGGQEGDESLHIVCSSGGGSGAWGPLVRTALPCSDRGNETRVRGLPGVHCGPSRGALPN